MNSNTGAGGALEDFLSSGYSRVQCALAGQVSRYANDAVLYISANVWPFFSASLLGYVSSYILTSSLVRSRNSIPLWLSLSLLACSRTDYYPVEMPGQRI